MQIEGSLNTSMRSVSAQTPISETEDLMQERSLEPVARASAVPMLDRLQRLARGELPLPPIAALLGFTLSSVSPGQATIVFEATERHANPMGTLHGGVLCDIADAAMGIAYASLLAADETFTTLELKVNFLKPVWHARLQAIGKVVRRGRTIGLVECDVVDAAQTLVARGTSTCMTLRGTQAEGRQVEG